jgi:hypothetical protein
MQCPRIRYVFLLQNAMEFGVVMDPASSAGTVENNGQVQIYNAKNS